MRELPGDIVEDISQEQLPPRQRLAHNVRKRTKDGTTLVDYWLYVVNNPNESTKNRLKASELLAQRGYGKPQESVDVQVQAGGSPLASLPTSLLKALAEMPEDQVVDAIYRVLPTDGQSADTVAVDGVLVTEPVPNDDRAGSEAEGEAGGVDATSSQSESKGYIEKRC